MLDAYIIDAIKQEELERERAYDRRRVRLEIPMDHPRPHPHAPERPAHEMGDPVVIPLVPRPELEEDAA